MKLVERMSPSVHTSPNRRTRQEFAQDLITTQQIDDLIISDLGNYIEFANTLVKKDDLTVETHKQLDMSDNHPFTHFKNLKSRLKRLRALLLWAKKPLNPGQIERIWEFLAEKSELRENDQNIFYNWFKSLLGKDQKELLADDLLVDLFRNKIVKTQGSMLKALRVNGLECIVRLFVLVNEQKGNVEDLEAQQSSNSNWQESSGAGYASLGLAGSSQGQQNY